MKKYRVKEEYIQTVWTYIYAESEDDLKNMVNNLEHDIIEFKEIDFEHKQTHWYTLREIK